MCVCVIFLFAVCVLVNVENNEFGVWNFDHSHGNVAKHKPFYDMKYPVHSSHNYILIFLDYEFTCGNYGEKGRKTREKDRMCNNLGDDLLHFNEKSRRKYGCYGKDVDKTCFWKIG